MSLRSEPIPNVPFETARIAHAAFPKGNLYLKMRDELGTFYEDADFAALFSTRGQPAFSPWRLALITASAVCRRAFRPAGCRSGSRSS